MLAGDRCLIECARHLLPLDRRRGLARDVVDDAPDFGDLACDTLRRLVEYVCGRRAYAHLK